MAEARSNMISFIDIGLLLGETTSNIVPLGKGFSDLTEDYSPKITTQQYINEDNASASVTGYETSFTISREYIDDDLQEVVDRMIFEMPTGSKCETYYYKLFKTRKNGDGSYVCSKMPVIIVPNSAGGSAGDPLKTELQVNGNGTAVLGKMTISGTTYTFAES